MQGIEEAIKLAIEKGGLTDNGNEIYWEEKTKSWWSRWQYEDYDTGRLEWNERPLCYDHWNFQALLLLKPIFWQALGKALGWGIQIGDHKGDVHVNHSPNGGECTELCIVPSIQMAHRYLDAHFEGQEAEDKFWKELK